MSRKRTETKLTVVLEWGDQYSHRSYDAPPSWSPGDIHRALQSKGFRPCFGSGPSVRVTLLRVPPVTLLRTGSEKIGYVSGISGGPSAYFLPDADKEQTAEALLDAGFRFHYEGRLVSAEQPSWV